MNAEKTLRNKTKILIVAEKEQAVKESKTLYEIDRKGNEFELKPTKTLRRVDFLPSDRDIHSFTCACQEFGKPHLRDQFHQRFGIVFNQVLRTAVEVCDRGVIDIQAQVMEQRGVDFTE